jgi:putative DNA methylase
MAVIAEGPQGRAYVAPTQYQEETAEKAQSSWKPDLRFEPNALGFRVGNYGMKNFGDLFTERQLCGLDSFVDAIKDIRKEIEHDAASASPIKNDARQICAGGEGGVAYADALNTYLSFLVGQLANHGSTICGWNSTNSQMRSTFSRQALPMTWDFAECNLFSGSSGSFESLFTRMVKGFESLAVGNIGGIINQCDAQSADFLDMVISTDPPYYDNIGYADLSDFFYVWMRRCLREIHPDTMGLLMTPKKEELVATPVRHGGRQPADDFFLEGMTKTLSNMAKAASKKTPATIYYAFKQSEIEQEGISSTGWATFLDAVVQSGFSVVGTWPIRTEKPGRMRAVGSNALANSVVLVCRKREARAKTNTRAEFIRALKRELPPAIAELQAANIAPADMPQSAIGPGMGVFSRHAAVLEADDSPMSVKTALQLINRELDEFLNDVQGEFDAETRFAITWFEQNGYQKGEYGTANSIAQARGISVESVKHAGIVESAVGSVRILKRSELPEDWTPEEDTHPTVWEACQHLIRILETEGEEAAATMLKRYSAVQAEAVKDLAYCLYDICSNKRKNAKEATAYNGLIAVWSDLTRLAASIRAPGGEQTTMDV